MTNENYLAHYGVKGMKWGVKTSKDNLKAGRNIAKGGKDVTESAKTISKTVQNRRNRTREEEAQQRAKESIENIDTAELQRRVNRMNLEQQYSKMSSQNVNSGRNTVEDILSITGAALGIASAGFGIALAIKTLSGK